MSSGISFSGFNKIDFSAILNAVMQQESRPLTALQTRQSDLTQQSAAFSTLATKVAAVQSAVSALKNADTLSGFTATSSDTAILSASGGSASIPGRYDVVVNELARSQVTASDAAATFGDSDTTVVATDGTLTIGGVAVTIPPGTNTTLRGLADAINGTTGIGVTASIVQSSPNNFRLVLTGKETGLANAFTVTNGLTGGTGISFTDPDAVDAVDASVKINNVTVTSGTNTLDAAIPGVTLTLTKKDPLATVAVTVAGDNTALKGKINAFASAYNSLLTFERQQRAAAGVGETDNIGRDPLLRSLRSSLSAALTTEYATGGTNTYLSQVGIGFDRAGNVTVDQGVLDTALANGTTEIAKLFTSVNGAGAFSSIDTLLTEYSQAGGLVPTAKDRVDSMAARMGAQIDTMQVMLNTRRASLQKEYTAADLAMQQLSSQSSTLQSLGGGAANLFF